MRAKSLTCLAAAAVISAAPATAEVVSATPDHYTLRHEAVCDLPPDALWARLVAPSEWWASDHTYSGDAGNLILDATAGGAWREDWDTGSVIHGTVLYAEQNKTLRLDAPFGPLQEMGVTVIWTISLSPEGEGTRIVFTETANGTVQSHLDLIAEAVDGVKAQAIASLASTPTPAN